MTTLRFHYPKDLISQPLLHRTFFASCGRVPTPTQVKVDGNELLLASEATGSGTVHFPWPSKRLGLTFLLTETLCERERPYHLVKELVRGQLGRVIRRFVEQVYYGFKPNDKLRQAIRLEVARFATLATSDETSPEIDQPMREMLERVVHLGFTLNEMFLEQSLNYRRQQTPLFPIHLGVNVNMFSGNTEQFESHTDKLQDVFHLINATPSWRELEPSPDVFRWELFDQRIETLRNHGFSVIGGPILQYDFHSVPKWVLAQTNDGDQFERFALKYVDTFLEHFADKVDFWILAGKLNSQLLEHCPTQRLLELTRQVMQVFKNHNPTSPGVVGIDQPWGDYLLHHGDLTYAPFHIAEELAGIANLDGIMLDVNIGLSSQCSYPRDPMAFSAMIDQWSYFGKPIYFSFGIPSELGTNPEFPDEYVGISFDWSRKTQQEWVHRCVPILLSKRSVAGIFWNQLEDSEFSEFANFGLLDTFGRLKPAYRKLAALRSTYVH